MIPQMEPHIDDAERKAMADYLSSGDWLTEHLKTRTFEQAIKDYTGSKYCAVVTNGTSALAMALCVSGVCYGDEVLVPDFTMIATANAVRMIGAIPVFVDIEAETLCMDMVQAAVSVTDKTKALIYVSLNGRAGVMGRVHSFCDVHDLAFIEDACQSLGSFAHGKHLGTFGDIGVFSFSSPKIITTGQGGALVTDNEELYSKILQLKDWGRYKGKHITLGYNFKFTDLQAVIGIEQMKKLSSRVDRKKRMFSQYYSKLKEYMVPMFGCIPWFIDIYVDDPKELKKHLRENHIETRLVYLPLDEEKVYEDGDHDYPVSKHYAHRGLWLPSSSQLTDEQINEVCDCILTFYERKENG